jgi:hypothetical protein
MLYISCPQPQQRSLNQNGGKLKAKAARYFTHVECMVYMLVSQAALFFGF